MGLHDVGEIASLFEVNIAAAASIGFVDPLLAQLDLMLFGQFGLGSLQADLTLQFNAAISASAQLNLQVSNPFLPLQAVIAAILQLQAAIEFLLASGLPTVSLQLSAQLSAAASLAATLSLKLGGIRLLLEVAIALKLAAVKFFADLQASLSAGPVHILSFDQTPAPFSLANAGTSIDTLFSTGLSGILPSDPVYGLVIVTKAPSAWAGIQATLLTA
jgi:hypothetical protein